MPFSGVGRWSGTETLVHDARALWPDTLSLAANGHLYFTANQLHRQARYHDGKDQQEKPYALFRVKADAEAGIAAEVISPP